MKSEYHLKPSFCASALIAVLLPPALRASSTVATLAETLAAVRRGVDSPRTSKRGCLDGGGSSGAYQGLVRINP